MSSCKLPIHNHFALCITLQDFTAATMEILNHKDCISSHHSLWFK